MSRYDQPSEPDLDRYETRTDDIDVPDFDAPDDPTPVGRQSMSMGFQIAGGAGGSAHATDQRMSDQPVDPAEHAAHAVMDAVHAMRAELAKVNDLERAIVVKGLIHGAFILLDDVDLSASDKISECMERRR